MEAALTLPLIMFVLLGTLQLFMMFHARILTQVAAFYATRAGSVNHGNCDRMKHAAILTLLPAIEPFAKPSGNINTNLAAAFQKRANNVLNEKTAAGSSSHKNLTYTGAIVWIVRDLGERVGFGGFNNGQDVNFDQAVAPQRLETQLIFFYPMKIPFANWVMARMFMVHMGLDTYTYQNPLMPVQTANWRQYGTRLNAAIAGEMASRMQAGEYVFPITASYTMRLMTPLKQNNWATKNCTPTPATL